MTDEAKRIADLERQLSELKDKVDKATPKPEPTWEERERAAAKWRDEMHQMQERRMSVATPPSVIQDWNVLDTATCQDLWRHGTVQSPSMAGTSGQSDWRSPWWRRGGQHFWLR